MSNTAEPRWVPSVAVEAIHRQQTLEHGGLHGLRSQTALDSALTRPQQRWSDGELSTIQQNLTGFEASTAVGLQQLSTLTAGLSQATALSTQSAKAA